MSQGTWRDSETEMLDFARTMGRTGGFSLTAAFSLKGDVDADWCDGWFDRMCARHHRQAPQRV